MYEFTKVNCLESSESRYDVKKDGKIIGHVLNSMDSPSKFVPKETPLLIEDLSVIMQWIDMRGTFEVLENKVQLHENVDIIYVVDGYIASFYTMDGNRKVAECHACTIFDALYGLQEKIVNWERR